MAIRARLAAVALALLLVQAAALAVSPIKACCDSPAKAKPKPAVMDCCRTGATGHICPIKSKAGEPICQIRSGCPTDATGFFAAAAWLGTIPDRVEIAAPPVTSLAEGTFSQAVVFWIHPPPTRPPRG